MTAIQEYFGCSCTDIRHTMRLSHYPSEDGKPLSSDENVIYLSILLTQWRNGIIPYFELSHISDILHKDFWKNYYDSSIISRTVTGIQYILGKYKEYHNDIFSAICIDPKDLNRLDKILSCLGNDKIIEGYIPIIEIESKFYCLQFVLDKVFDKTEILVDVQFKKLPFLNRLWRGLKYISGSVASNYSEYHDEFIITPMKAILIRRMIKQAQTGK